MSKIHPPTLFIGATMGLIVGATGAPLLTDLFFDKVHTDIESNRKITVVTYKTEQAGTDGYILPEECDGNITIDVRKQINPPFTDTGTLKTIPYNHSKPKFTCGSIIVPMNKY